MTANIAAISLSVEGGANLAEKVDPRMVEATLTEKRGTDADELSVSLHNHDGKLEMPEPGRNILLSLGWKSGDDVPVGMVGKGRFTVDEVGQEGPPDIVTFRARSADMTGDYRKRRTQSWRDTTLGTILGTIAGRYGVVASIESGLAAKEISAIEQEGKSDMAFVKDLGRRYDAIATWKGGHLLFMPIGASVSASGQALPAITLTRKSGWRWAFTRSQRGDYGGAEAQWHDTDAGKRKTVKVGSGKKRRLKRVYASEAEAKQAADASASRDKRAPYSFTYDLAVADPAIQPDQKVTLQGWGSTIDAITWLVESVETTLSAGGMVQSIKLESA